ncbi:hypothetical protein N8I77_010868 [Diaporthe amygdali]|uniref:Carboxylesterase type B domain-containing protein n=1 Tax=Phomopsis amygdali TaxID=1214568 RepID=A0AAD9S898_PHOAM|nr:hypothetical protein N8I77_010868 [Diaporthe amygdali]
MTQNTTLKHPALGSILGVDSDQTIQYRGIPYATLDHQFADAVLFENQGQRPIDATRYGPQSIQPSETCDMEHTFIQHALPHEELKDSPTECLNLNITVPKGQKKGLPVIVFVHGGGYYLGAGSWPQFDMRRLVALSTRCGKPVIGVTINYRLGAPGFLTSEELINHGIKPDRGLNDQVAAFTWLQHYIQGFGGDPSRVTASGVSAGSISILLHLTKNQPLFSQAVCMGGTPALMPLLPPEVAESTYATVLQKLSIADLPPAERIKKLKETDREGWVSQLGPGLPLSPVADKNESKPPFYQAGVPDDAVSPPGNDWCPRIMMGDCELDSSILAYMLGPGVEHIGTKFCVVLDKSLADNPDAKEAVLKAYDTRQEDDSLGFLRFAHDVVQLAATRLIASRWPGSTYVFHFNEPNPWEGRFQGVACHLLDTAFLFQNYEEFLNEEQASSGRTFGRHLIEFVNGEEPYAPFKAASGKVQVYGPGEPRSRQVDAKDLVAAGRRNPVFSLAEDLGLDRLTQIVHMTLHP